MTSGACSINVVEAESFAHVVPFAFSTNAILTADALCLRSSAICASPAIRGRSSISCRVVRLHLQLGKGKGTHAKQIQQRPLLLITPAQLPHWTSSGLDSIRFDRKIRRGLGIETWNDSHVPLSAGVRKGVGLYADGNGKIFSQSRQSELGYAMMM